jgi:hypothetical protein
MCICGKNSVYTTGSNEHSDRISLKNTPWWIKIPPKLPKDAKEYAMVDQDTTVTKNANVSLRLVRVA